MLPLWQMTWLPTLVTGSGTQLKKGIQEQSSIAQEALDQCEYVPELRKQWSDQQSAQLSIQAHNYVINLQQSF